MRLMHGRRNRIDGSHRHPRRVCRVDAHLQMSSEGRCQPDMIVKALQFTTEDLNLAGRYLDRVATMSPGPATKITASIKLLIFFPEEPVDDRFLARQRKAKLKGYVQTLGVNARSTRPGHWWAWSS
ncbi:hypothetical protein ACWA7J_05085 [Leptothrix sp. BB-4]